MFEPNNLHYGEIYPGMNYKSYIKTQTKHLYSHFNIDNAGIKMRYNLFKKL